MSHPVIIDTSVYVQHFRKGSYRSELIHLPYLIRNSSVVIAELSRGCRTQEEKNAIEELTNQTPLITPTEKVWRESGKLLSRLSEKKGYSPEKLKDLHFDCLIALSARSMGAVVITLDRGDFEEIKKLKDFKLICWEG